MEKNKKIIAENRVKYKRLKFFCSGIQLTINLFYIHTKENGDFGSEDSVFHFYSYSDKQTA